MPESILSVRQTAIQQLLEAAYSHANSFIRSAGTGKGVCRKENAKECDALVYGSLVISFQSVALWPPVDPQDIKMSINKLASTLLLVKPLAIPGSDRGYSINAHRACGVTGYRDTINEVLASITSPVLDNHRKRMASVK